MFEWMFAVFRSPGHGAVLHDHWKPEKSDRGIIQINHGC